MESSLKARLNLNYQNSFKPRLSYRSPTNNAKTNSYISNNEDSYQEITFEKRN